MPETTVIQPQDIERLILFVSPSREDSKEWHDIENTITFKCLSKIEHHKIPKELYSCWLICTEQSEKTAKFLRRHFATTFQFGNLPRIKGIDSALEIFELIMQVAAVPGNVNQAIFCDCTGGTKTMSIAMALACTHYNLTTTSQTNLILTYIESQANNDNIIFKKYDLSDVVAEEQRRHIEQQELMGRLRYMARLSPILAHEIKNPLTTINANLYLLRNKFSDQYSKNLLRMERAVKEISRTIDDIQRSVRKEADIYVPAKIQLTETVRRLTARTQRYFPDLTLKVKGELSRIQIRIPEEKLYTIFTNLIDNAANATKGRGTVILTFSSDQNILSIYMEDDGPGIPEELRSNLFKPMYKGINSPGTGMGLNIVKVFVAEEGGTITYDDTYEQGARFIIQFPLEKNGDIKK